MCLVDTDVKVWDSETGKNIANLKGHKGSVYSIKMSNDGSFAMSVGTDKFIHIWDVRQRTSAYTIDGQMYSDMNDISFSTSPSLGGSGGLGSQRSSGSGSGLNGLACVAHNDGTLTFWDMNMRKCLA